MKQSFYKKLFRRALITWVLFIPIVVLNGYVREAVYKPITGELTAHQISTVIASIAFVTLAYFRLKNQLLHIPNGILFQMGLMWVALTILFEIGLGRIILQASRDRLFQDYNLLVGRIWLLFLATILFTPVILKQLLANSKANQLQYGK